MSHYRNQCWLIIKSDLWHSSEEKFKRNVLEFHPSLVFPGVNELNCDSKYGKCALSWLPCQCAILINWWFNFANHYWIADILLHYMRQLVLVYCNMAAGHISGFYGLKLITCTKHSRNEIKFQQIYPDSNYGWHTIRNESVCYDWNLGPVSI